MAEANRLYDQAADIVEGIMVNVPSRESQARRVGVTSRIYEGHLRLVADRLHDSVKAYDIIERARGRAPAAGTRKRLCQFTGMDDCTRIRVLKKEEPMSISRSLIVHVLLALMLFVEVSPAAAASADHQVVTGTASFTIPAGQCPKLPAGVSVSGSGESVAIINTHTLPDGTIEVRVNNLIKGVAVDSNGGVHKFVYHNSSTETIPPSGDHSISMNDLFVLSGPGPNYSVGFDWRWTFTPPNLWPPVDNWEQLAGNPDEVFACDPL